MSRVVRQRVGSCSGVWLLMCGLWLVVADRMYGDVVVTRPYQGVTLTNRTESSPRPLHIHVVQIDLAAPGLRIMVAGGNEGQLRESTAATTLSRLTAEHARLGINAHFYQPVDPANPNKWVIGLGASQGKVFSAFEGPTPAAAVPNNSLTLDQGYAIMTRAPALNIDPDNHARIVHHDATQPDNKHVLEPVTLHNAVSGSAQIVTNGVTTIPAYTQNPMTGLTDGNGWSATHSWYQATNARTAIGLTADNRTLVLFTVDKAGGSSGMTVVEVADMLRIDYGVHNALNLDGGESTTLAMHDPATGKDSVINHPTDKSGGRAVATSLLVFAGP